MSTYEVTLVVPENARSDAAGETVTIDVHEDEYVLAAARANSHWLPADCQQGWCTTCAGELLAGEVDQSNAKRYYDVDLEAGFVLLCIAKPRSDLRVLTHQEEAMLEHRAANSLPPGRSKRS